MKVRRPAKACIASSGSKAVIERFKLFKDALVLKSGFARMGGTKRPENTLCFKLRALSCALAL